MGEPKSFRINLLTETQEHFPGSYLQGNVFLELSKDMVPLTSIEIRFLGIAFVNWSVQQGMRSLSFTGREDICRLVWTIWSNETSAQQHVSSTGLSAGQYEFPFTIQIPADLALLTSFQDPYGFIQYSVTAGITRYEETEFKYFTMKTFIVKAIVNTNVPRLMQPLSNHTVRMIRTFWRNRGSILLSAKIDRGGYCPGEYISINAKFENQSTRRINIIHASLIQRIKYSAKRPSWYKPFSPRERTRQVSTLINRIQSSGIAPGKTGHWNNELIPIPAIPPTTIGDHIIKLSYFVYVTVDIHKADHLFVQIPVTIGTTPFAQTSLS